MVRAWLARNLLNVTGSHTKAVEIEGEPAVSSSGRIPCVGN